MKRNKDTLEYMLNRCDKTNPMNFKEKNIFFYKHADEILDKASIFDREIFLNILGKRFPEKVDLDFEQLSTQENKNNERRDSYINIFDRTETRKKQNRTSFDNRFTTQDLKFKEGIKKYLPFTKTNYANKGFLSSNSCLSVIRDTNNKSSLSKSSSTFFNENRFINSLLVKSKSNDTSRFDNTTFINNKTRKRKSSLIIEKTDNKLKIPLINYQRKKVKSNQFETSNNKSSDNNNNRDSNSFNKKNNELVPIKIKKNSISKLRLNDSNNNSLKSLNQNSSSIQNKIKDLKKFLNKQLNFPLETSHESLIDKKFIEKMEIYKKKTPSLETKNAFFKMQSGQFDLNNSELVKIKDIILKKVDNESNIEIQNVEKQEDSDYKLCSGIKILNVPEKFKYNFFNSVKFTSDRTNYDRNTKEILNMRRKENMKIELFVDYINRGNNNTQIKHKMHKYNEFLKNCEDIKYINKSLKNVIIDKKREITRQSMYVDPNWVVRENTENSQKSN